MDYKRDCKLEGFFPCSVCDKTVKRKKELRNHIEDHPGIPCDRCYSVFETDQEAAEHNEEYQSGFGLPGHPSLEHFPCEICKRKFNSVCEQRTHELCHYQTRECFICNKKLTAISSFSRHVRRKHPNEENYFLALPKAVQ